MDRETNTIVLVLVTMLLVFLAVQPIIPSYGEKFSELGVLGPNKTISNYPTSVLAGETVSLYGYVGNHEGYVAYYTVMVKLGNSTTHVSNSTSATAPLIANYSRVLDNNQSWVFPIDISVNKTGTNLKLIFELWMYNATASEFEYTGLWNQLYINVTKV